MCLTIVCVYLLVIMQRVAAQNKKSTQKRSHQHIAASSVTYLIYLAKKPQKDANGKKGLVVINLTASNQLGFGVDIGKSCCCDVCGVEIEIRVFRTCSIFIYAPIVCSVVETPSEAPPIVLIKCPGRCVKLSKL